MIMAGEHRYYRPEGSYSPPSSVSSPALEAVDIPAWKTTREDNRLPFIRVNELMEHDEPVFARSQRRSLRSWFRQLGGRKGRCQLSERGDDEFASESFPTTFLVRKLGWKRRICFTFVVSFFFVM